MSNSRLVFSLTALSTGLAIAFAGCGEDEREGLSELSDDRSEVLFPEVTTLPEVSPFEVTTPPETADTSEVVASCESAGAFGCPCATATDCIDGLCVEGPDGSTCTRLCDAVCPDGMDCVLTAIGGDPQTICVPRHARLCRPCDAAADCQSALDPNPAACIAGENPADGSFCATSCLATPCPEGFACQDVAVGGATAKLCRPVDENGDSRVCECRPAWAELALTTSCQLGTCPGTRTCTADGLGACTSSAPAGSDCCGNASDCDHGKYGSDPVCEDATTCTGTRVDPQCLDNVCATGEVTGDDSACAGLVADTCGLYASIVCSGAIDQPRPVCPESCSGDSECDENAFCHNGACVPDQPPGSSCVDDAQCADDLSCVDGVCCTSSCDGACRRCDLDEGGTCAAIERGVDPDDECAGLSCTGYYWGFDGKVCYRRANVTASSVSCDGDFGCQMAEDVCPSAARGPEASACHAECQVPKSGTCQFTTPPDCIDIPGGTRTCGIGACAVAVPLCTGGDYTACEPGEESPEQCDGIDNDCDGFTDADDPDLVMAECDKTEGVCAGTQRTADLCVGGKWQACPDAYYAANSPYYEPGHETTCEGVAGAEGLDNDCDGAVDDDFIWTEPNGTQVVGAGKACGLGRCADGTTLCGRGNNLYCTTSGAALEEACNGADDDCDGAIDSLDPTLVRVPCEDQDGACKGATKDAGLCAAGQWQPCQAAQYAAANTAYEASETRCDGVDNDCNGGTDTNLPGGPLNSNQLGVCAGSRQRCEGLAGWKDFYSAQTITNYDENESAPDANYRDENCDGVDGDLDAAILVDGSGGSDVVGCGVSTQGALTSFCRTVKYAVENRTSPSRRFVLVAQGDYDGPILLNSNANIWGGYQRTSGTTWARKPRSEASVRIRNGFVATLDHHATLYASGFAGGITVADLIIVGANATTVDGAGRGRSTYAVYANGVTLTLERVDITQGDGAAGRAGSNGAGFTGSNQSGPGGGGNARDGSLAFVCDAGTPPGGGGGGRNFACGGTDGGAGGSGGKADGGCDCFLGACVCGPCGATSGTGGGEGEGSGGGPGGGSGACGTPGGGNPGGTQHGAGGSGASLITGSLAGSPSIWVAQSGDSGTLGNHGGGGGGGGGSGGCDNGVAEPDTYGAGGGGGGAGGCRAPTAGGGGGGGGGSFGIFAVNATVTVRDSIITRGSGGAGGAGGTGGSGESGQSGASGGTAAYGSRAGGRGGDGGDGGSSGSGGGGAGGVSAGIFRFGGSVASFNTTVSLSGSGGTGGPAGVGGIVGSAGPNGRSAQIWTCAAAGDCD